MMQESPVEMQNEVQPRSRWSELWRDVRAFVDDPRFVRIALLAILLLAASMRVMVGINWDSQTHLHPDERFLTDVETKLAWPKSLGDYFNEAKSPLNPYNREVGMFVYGTLPMFIVKALGTLTKQETYWQIHFVGRYVSGACDLITVLLVYFIGRRLYNKWAGLLGSLLMACTVLAIQHAHFFVVEPMLTMFVTLAFFFTIRVVDDGGWLNWALLGASYGLALACKISAAYFGIVMAGACILRALKEPPVAAIVAAGPRILWRSTFGRLSVTVQSDNDTPQDLQWEGFWRGLIKAGFGMALALVVAFLFFRIAQPYAFQGPGFFGLKLSPRWLQDMKIAQNTASGAVDMPPGHQWTDRSILFGFRNIVLFGMGLPLGIAAWLGWLVAWVEVLRKKRLEHLLLLVWVTFTFVQMSAAYVKVVRYFLPIYPLLVALAGYFTVWLWRNGKGLAAQAAQRTHAWARRLSSWAPWAAAVVGVAIVLGTFLYAEAFTNIYRRPLSRVTASEWIYNNIPAGSTLTWEEWDDILPVSLPNKDSGQYKFVKTTPYGEDADAGKLPAVLSWLDQADYIIFSSNRLYGSIPRLPERYPLTTAYYKYLFDGSLGFQVIKKITSYPNLGPIEFSDESSDEAFTVYDHPQVTILKKTDAYSHEKAAALLGAINTEHLMQMSPMVAMKSHHGLLLTALEKLVQQAGGTWSEMFNRGSLANRAPVIAWLVVVELLALAGLPFAFVVFRRFRDRGYLFAKAIGILLVAWLAWLGAGLHVIPYTRLSILGCLMAVLAIGAIIAWRRWDEVYEFVRQEWRTLLLEEGLFLAFFAAFLLVRYGNPDLWHPGMGGEKPMDLAYLNAIIKSTWFPPYDPWYAGGYINYYYFGQVIVATVIKLSAIVPTTAYNLALPTLFALTAVGGYSVVSGLLGERAPVGKRPVFDRAAKFGLFGALLIAVLGNLGEVRLLYNGLVTVSNLNFKSSIPGLEGLVKSAVGLYQVAIGGKELPFRPEWWYWNASRVMGKGEINEFPYFTFLYADLHAHLIALPFATLALGLISNLLHVGRRQRTEAAASDAAPAAMAADGDATEQAQAPDWLPASAPAEGVASVAAPAEGYRARLRRWAASVDWAEWLCLGLLALVLGELWANNTWDFPTYLVIAACGLIVGRMLTSDGIDWRQAGAVVGRLVVLAAGAYLLLYPFHARYGAAYTAVDLWKGARTPIGDYLVIHGVFLFILLTYVSSRALGRGARGGIVRRVRLLLARPLQWDRYGRLSDLFVRPGAGYAWTKAGLVLLAIVAFILLAVGWWLAAVALPLAALGLSLAFRRDLGVGEKFAALLFTAGLLLTAGVEYIVLRGDIGRMNTVFKFYLQVWVLWGVAAAVALAVLAERWQNWRPGGRFVWQAVLGLLVVGAALYPIYATWGKVNDRFDKRIGPSLDGTAYTQTATYSENGKPLQLKDDMAAIRWLQENIQGSPVILEANGPLYHWTSRISIYTGLPTVIGWDWHQRQQRAVVASDVVAWRMEDLRKLYDGTDTAVMARLLQVYNVSYVYVGELERATYSAAGLAKFENLAGTAFDVVYQQGPVTIYRVRTESLGGLAARPLS